jgi:O-antigen/teichoic acid export membrane protein
MSDGAPEPAAEGASPDGPDSVARNTASAFLLQIVGATFTATLTLVLVRVLGPHDYGVYALALGVAAVALPFTDFGVAVSAGRFIAEHRGDPAAIRAVLGHAIRLKALIGAIAGLALLLLAEPIASAYGVSSLAWALRAMSLAVVAQSFMVLLIISFEALGRISVSVRMVFTESAIEASAAIALVLAGLGAAGAVLGRAIGYMCGVAVGAYLLRRVIASMRNAAKPSDAPSRKRIGTYAVALVATELVITACNEIDVLLIGAYLTPVAAGIFQAPIGITAVLHYPGLALSSGVSPVLAERGRRAAERFDAALRLVILVQAFSIAVIAVWATPIVDLLFGPEYEESAEVLRALAPFIFLSGIAPLVAIAGNYLGAARQRLPIALATLAINAILDVLLIPRIGVVGAAIATGAGFAFYVPAQYWICRKQLSLHSRATLITLARSALAASAMAAVLLTQGTESLSPIQAIVGGLLGAAAYAATLIATRETSVRELRGLAVGLRARLRRAEP